MNDHKTPIRLLPHVFKKVGFVLLALSILLLTLSIIGIIEGYKGFILSLFQSILLLGLLLLAISKDKEEDELTVRLRLQTFAVTFSFGVLFVILKPFVNLIFSFENETNSSDQLLEVFIQMFIFHFLMYYFAKATR